MIIKQNQSSQRLVFFMADSTSHYVGKTGLSPTVLLSKNGGPFSAASGAIGEIAYGWYNVSGHVYDSNTVGPLILYASGTGADPVNNVHDVVAYDMQNSGNLGLTSLPSYNVGASGGLQTLDGNLEQTIRRGTIGTYTSTTVFALDAGASATHQFYTGMTIELIGPSGFAGIGQTRLIRDYNGASKQVTVDALTTAAVSNSTQYKILSTASWINNTTNGTVVLVTTTTTATTATTATNLTNWPTVVVPAAGLGSIAGSVLVSGNAAGWRAGYEEGNVWLDTVNGVAGTTTYVNGIVSAPTNLIASAFTITTALKINKIRSSNNSVLVPASTLANYELLGENYTLDLNNQIITNTVIRGALVSGLSTGQGANFYNSQIGNITLDSCWIYDSVFTGTLTTVPSGIYVFKNCSDGIAGDPNPTLVLKPNVIVGIRNYRGGINISGMGASNNVVVDGDCRVILGADCSGGVIKYRGFIGIDDQVVGGFSGTLTQSERYNIPYLMSNIVTSGNAVGWDHTANLAGLSGQIAGVSGLLQDVDNEVDYLSGVISNSNNTLITISGNLLRTENTLITVSGNVNTLPTTDVSSNVTAIKNTVQSVSYGNSALLTAVQNVQNNTFIAATIPAMLERPATGSVVLGITICFSDETGTAKDLDSGNPVVTLVNDLEIDVSSRLGIWHHPDVGKYTINYTNSSTDDLEGLHWEITGTINGKLRRYPGFTQLVDTTAVDFTSTDRQMLTDTQSVLDTVYNNILNIPTDTLDQQQVRDAMTLDPTSALQPNSIDVFLRTIKSITSKGIDGVVVYISATGNDANDGYSLPTSVLTIGRALDIIAGTPYPYTGGIIFMFGGVYNENVVIPENIKVYGILQPLIRGNSNTSPIITLGTYSEIHNIIIAPETGAMDSIILMQSSSKCNNIWVQNGSAYTINSVISLDISSSNQVISNSILHGQGSISSAISGDASKIIIENNTFRQFTSDYISLPTGSVTYTIRNNIFENIPSGCFAINGQIEQFTVTDNKYSGEGKLINYANAIQSYLIQNNEEVATRADIMNVSGQITLNNSIILGVSGSINSGVLVSNLSPNALSSITTSNISGRLSEITTDPGATPTFGEAVMLNYMDLRNKKVQEDPTAADKKYFVYNDNGDPIASGTIVATNGVFTKERLNFNG